MDARDARGDRLAELEARKEAKYREIRDAEMDFRTGKLSEEDHRALDRQLRAEAMEILRAIDEEGEGRGASRRCTLTRMENILSVVQVILAVVVIFLVLMHSGKDAGLSGAFGVGTRRRPVRRRLARRAQPQPLDRRLRDRVRR